MAIEKCPVCVSVYDHSSPDGVCASCRRAMNKERDRIVAKVVELRGHWLAARDTPDGAGDYNRGAVDAVDEVLDALGVDVDDIEGGE